MMPSDVFRAGGFWHSRAAIELIHNFLEGTLYLSPFFIMLPSILTGVRPDGWTHYMFSLRGVEIEFLLKK